MAGIPSAILRKWKIFSNWSQEELEKVVYVNIFRINVEPHPPTQLGAVLLTTDDEVFYEGPAHPLFGGSTDPNKTKVDGLCGLNIKKLEVAKNFCVVLTIDHKMYLWGGPEQIPRMIPNSAYVYFEPFESDTTCPTCSKKVEDHYNSFGRNQLHHQHYLSMFEFAGVQFKNGCIKCKSSPKTYTSEAKPTGKKLVELVKFKDAAICCPKCNAVCTAYKIASVEVNYCKFCNYLPQDATHYAPFETTLKPELMDLGESNEVVDVACGYEFFVAITKRNVLILWGKIDDAKYQGTIYNPDSVIVKAVACGGKHVAILSVDGDVYTCGKGGHGQLGYEWHSNMVHVKLRKVPLEGKVVKVCCGWSSTVCLMTDGSLMCFGSDMKMMYPDELALNQGYKEHMYIPARIMQTSRFTDVVNSPLTKVYFAKTETLMFAWGRASDRTTQPELVFGGGDLTAALADLPATFTFKAPCKQRSTLSPHLDSQLYGQKNLSDLTLKLSDGEFPAHRLILYANSVYFRGTFGESNADDVLDMTHYNPEAYRCLLKYFYQLPPTELIATDLFDLYVLANSYKETAISQEVFTKLKANLNPDTVLPLLRKAKEVNCTEFLDECNAFIRSPEFKHILAEKVSEDMDKTLSTLSLLEVMNDKK